jgi:phytoene dehydrogenase-like protein
MLPFAFCISMFDVIIIGAGIGGLTTAALLARAGRSVLLLEGHIEPGGCASSFQRKRPDGDSYVFDVGATLFGGFQPGGAHHWVARKLRQRFPAERLEPAMQVWLPDRSVTRYGDARWPDERRRAFPEQAHAAERFWLHQERIAAISWRFAGRLPPMPPETAGDLLRLLPTLRPEMASLLPHLGRSVGDELRRCRITDRALRTFVDAQLLISAQVTADECAWLFGSVALDLPHQGVFYAPGGAWTTARTLADAFLRDGGELRYRTRVSEIIVENGSAAGVRTDSGEEYRAERTPNAWGAFTLYLGIDEEAVPLDLPCEHHQVVLAYDEPLGEGNSAFLSLHPAHDASRAPAGQRALTVSTHSAAQPWWDARAQGRAAYAERKALFAERLLAAVERVLPDVRRHIRYQQSGTPVTFQRYTRRRAGMVGGLGQRPAQSGLASFGPRAAGVQDLWLVGDSTFPGQSTAAVTQGGIRVFHEVQRALFTAEARRRRGGNA